MGRQLRHGIALGICSLFSSTAAALLLLHCCDWLYRWDIAALRISEATGLSQQVILRNYHAMMDYLWPLSEGAFSLPDLPFSAQGALHFADCRRLFAIVYLVGIAAALGLLWLWRRRRRDPVDKRAFLIAGATLVGCIALVGGALAVNPSGAFTLFHKLLFSNDYWLFDPLRDPVILLLPEQFFFNCAGVFALFCSFSALLLVVAGRKRKIDRLRQPK